MRDQMNNSMRMEDDMAGYRDPISLDGDVNFIGWQETLSGKSFPLFNISIAAHPLYGSTVSEATLRQFGLQVPQILSTSNVKDSPSK